MYTERSAATGIWNTIEISELKALDSCARSLGSSRPLHVHECDVKSQWNCQEKAPKS
jgi:hypothetical protein